MGCLLSLREFESLTPLVVFGTDLSMGFIMERGPRGMAWEFRIRYVDPIEAIHDRFDGTRCVGSFLALAEMKSMNSSIVQ